MTDFFCILQLKNMRYVCVTVDFWPWIIYLLFCVNTVYKMYYSEYRSLRSISLSFVFLLINIKLNINKY